MDASEQGLTMKQIDWVYQQYGERRFPLPSEDDIARLEARLNLRFPPDYRQFLLDYNGGWFGDHELAVPEDVWNDQIHCLYGIRADHEAGELGQPSDISLFDDNDPPQIVIIGHTSTNQLIVLGVHPETYGQIFFKTYWSRASKTEQEWFWWADSIEDVFDLISEPHSEEDAT